MLTTLLINILLLSLVIFSFVTLVFFVAQWKQDNSIMDIAYGPLVALGAWATLLIGEVTTPLAVLIAILITLWATRLSLRIARKNWGRPEDARYRAWREAWMKRGAGYFALRSYLQINLLQGVVIVIISLPFLVALSHGPALGSIWTVVGTAIMLFGLSYETIADWQLDRYMARKRAGTEPANLMTTGLFRYSRRPNYFGESLVWWGLAVIAYPLSFGPVAFLSPLLITYVVAHVTGPMLERIFLEKYPEEYQAYMQRTNYFIPSRPRS